MAYQNQGSSGLKIKTNISEASEDSKEELKTTDKIFSTRNSFNVDSQKKGGG